MSEQDEEVTAALKLQQDGRKRAKAQNLAYRRLKEAHPEEYARYYAEEREKDS